MRYQLLQIREGKESVLLDTDSKKEIRERYARDDMTRIRIDGRTLLIFQADDWANGKPIREYREAIARKPKIVPVENGKRKPVIMITPGCEEVRRFESLIAAADAIGYGCIKPITLACNTGKPTGKGFRFRWAE